MNEDLIQLHRNKTVEKEEKNCHCFSEFMNSKISENCKVWIFRFRNSGANKSKIFKK